MSPAEPTTTTAGPTTSSSTHSAHDTALPGTAHHGIMAEHAGLRETTAASGDITAGPAMTGSSGSSSADVGGGTFRSTTASGGVRGVEVERGASKHAAGGVGEAVRSALQPSAKSEVRSGLRTLKG
jgi:hypothetical protein